MRCKTQWMPAVSALRSANLTSPEYVQAACALIAIAFVHSDNRLTSIIGMLLFATGVATAVLLIAAHDRPFIGEISVSPDPLLQVMPQPES
jgi:hypothetical protein